MMKPSLDLNKKLSNKAGILFPGAPLFEDLPDTDISMDSSFPSLSNQGKMTIQQLDDAKDDIEDEYKARKRRRRRQRDPTVKQLRDHLRKISLFHTRVVEEELPSVYPILGPAGGKSDDEDQSSDSGRDHDRERKSHKKQ